MWKANCESPGRGAQAEILTHIVFNVEYKTKF